MKTLNTMTMAEWMLIEEIWENEESLEQEEFVEFIRDNKDDLNAFQYKIEGHILTIW